MRVSASVGNVEEALVLGAILTVAVVFLFLNSWRSTVITGLALPVSVLASFMAVAAFGFTLNMMSLLGLSLAIGILIDDAIVVRENIVRHVEMGKDHFTAAHDGTDEIGLAVAATTFSILAVFIPVAFLTGESGQWFKPFALTIACSVLVSLFVSFSLDPMLSAYWPDPDVPMEQRSFISRGLDRFNRWFDRRTDNYKRVIGWALDSHLRAELALAALDMALASRDVMPGGLVHHSDRGVQYACGDYVARLAAAGIQPSMSRVGCPYDNAMAESFMKTFKQEEVDGRAYRDIDAARAQIARFLDEVYNRQRLHSALAYQSPVEFEAQLPQIGQLSHSAVIATCP